MGNSEWLEAEGPHVLMPERQASRGLLPENRIALEAYERSAIEEEIPVSVLNLGDDQALIFGQGMPASSWMFVDWFAGGILIIPVEWPNWPDLPEERLKARVKEALWSTQFYDTGVRFQVGGELVLAPARPNVEIESDHGAFHIPYGGYAILSGSLILDGDHVLVLALASHQDLARELSSGSWMERKAA